MTDEQASPLESRVQRALRDLASSSAAKRRDAAYFLGEAAHGDAIPTLISLYQTDKSPEVRKAAAYALGMFRAVEVGLRKKEEAKVTALLSQVEVAGKLGKRAPTAKRLRTAGGLVLSLGILIVLFLFQGTIAGALLGGKTERSALLNGARAVFVTVSSDTRNLQTVFLNVISNQALDCAAFFNSPERYRYTLDQRDASANPDIAAVTRQINAVGTSLTSALVPYSTACNGNPADFGSAQAGEAYRTLLVPVVPQLTELELELTTLAGAEPPKALFSVMPTTDPASIPPATALSVEVSPPTATPTTAGASDIPVTVAVSEPPTVAPEPTLNVQRHLPDLYRIIDDVNGARGAATLLVQYWQDVNATGTTAGCDISVPPPVPSNDVFIEEMEYAQSENLRQAVALINSGLAALRDGWVSFRFSCNSRTLEQDLSRNLATANTAQSAFLTANVFLDQVRSGG